MIYFDHHAATPLANGVLAVMSEVLEQAWANPSSVHTLGRVARRYQEDARDSVAVAIGAKPADVVLCGGGTEACNLGVLGLSTDATAIATTDVEHPAVEEAVLKAAEAGKRVHRLTLGAFDSGFHDARLGKNDLLAVQWVNHEVGSIIDVVACIHAAKESGARVFVDATQALGKLPVDVEKLGADAVAFASQKIGGPPGAGALYVNRSVEMPPHHLGGSQERGRRAGSPDLAAWVGFGAACTQLPQRLGAMPGIQRFRDRIEEALLDLGGVLNGGQLPRVSTATNVAWDGWKAEQLVAALDLEGLCVSAGAACSSGMQSDSAVLLGMYPDEQWRAGSSIRSSLGMETTKSDVDEAIQAFTRVLSRGPEKT